MPCKVRHHGIDVVFILTAKHGGHGCLRNQVKMKGCPNHEDVVHQRLDFLLRETFYYLLHLVSRKLARSWYVNYAMFRVGKGEFVQLAKCWYNICK